MIILTNNSLTRLVRAKRVIGYLLSAIRPLFIPHRTWPVSLRDGQLTNFSFQISAFPLSHSLGHDFAGVSHILAGGVGVNGGRAFARDFLRREGPASEDAVQNFFYSKG